MFSDEEIKEIPEGGFMRPGDEIISIREICLSDKTDRKNSGLHLLPNSSRNDLDVSRSLFRDGFFPEGLEQQARFAWTEEDGNIASLVSEPGFGTTGQTTFGKQIDSAFNREMKEADSSSVLQPTNRSSSYGDCQLVSSTSSGNPNSVLDSSTKSSQTACKVDKADPRSRFHFVKYVKRHGRTIKLWECGICGREFQHQYTLMRHLPTHTDERNFHCNACGKSFRQLSTLSQHKAIHSAERPYACEVCNKTFNRVSTLISHRKTHSDEKPYRCHMCPKGFHQKGNLRNHLFTHTNERPYRCNICFAGFNQQSNLVCHKNKAHPEDGSSNVGRRNLLPRLNRAASEPLPENSNRSQMDQCEVSSSVGPGLPSYGSRQNPHNTDSKEPFNLISGVIVDAIKTYYMGVAIATKQTPFALLKPDDGAPVLVKVVDTSLPGGKQMLVPATAEDLRTGGKIIVNNDEDNDSQEGAGPGVKEGGVQIRVPVVATVVPRVLRGRLVALTVEEPHRAYHTTLSADLLDMSMEGSVKTESQPGPSHAETRYIELNSTGTGKDFSITVQDMSMESSLKKEPQPGLSHAETRYIELNSTGKEFSITDGGISSSSSLGPPSPPLDLIPMDLFEPMECMPLGPQITAVDNIDHPPPSDDDIFIGKFEESIPLSDSD